MNQIIKLSDIDTSSLNEMLMSSKTAVVLLPLGSTEPHGPHLPLSTDVILAEENARRSAALFDDSFLVFLAPTVAYGVTDFAAGFKGAIGISASTLSSLVDELVTGFLGDGFDHVSLINHHLDPGHVHTIQRTCQNLWQKFGTQRVSHPSVLNRRWGRHLGDEFRSGACHAGEYEGSMVLAATEHLFRQDRAAELPPLELSLSDGIQEGVSTFAELGMTEAYTGNPKKSTKRFGNDLYSVLSDMVFSTVVEHLEGVNNEG